MAYFPKVLPRRATRSAPSVTASAAEEVPLLVPIQCLEEDPRNPRKELPEEHIAELAEDIALRGILQPIVVHRLADAGRYCILFGAKRPRAAKRASTRPMPSARGSTCCLLS